MTPNQISVAFTSGATCAHCRRVCRLPGQSIQDFVKETGKTDALSRPRSYRLMVVRLNGDSQDDRIANLKPLCISCGMSLIGRRRKKPIFPRRRRYL